MHTNTLTLEEILLLSLFFLPSQAFHQRHWQPSAYATPLRIATQSPRKDSTTTLPTPLPVNRPANTRRHAIKSTETKDEQSESRAIRKLQIAEKFRALTELEERQDQFFFALAVLPSFVAFVLWKDIALALSHLLETYGVARLDIDGMFANNLLRPTITGVVVPVIAIALATLVSTTINVLRDREVQLRTLINKESCDLHLLRQAVFGLFGTRQHSSRRARALALLCSYVEQLERESSLGAVEALEDMQLKGGIAANELNQLTRMLHGIDGAAACRQGSVTYADDLVRSLNDYRSERIAELLSGFPAIHWCVLIALGLSVCVTFLLASNQPMNEYLNALSLRALFALLVGVCSGTAAICINLADPFRGTFSVLDASAQLYELRHTLEKDIAEATAEAGEISSNLVHAILLGGSKDSSNIISGITETSVHPKRDKPDIIDQGGDWEKQDGDFKIKKEPRRYGLVQTFYFHLLTGPLGSNVKALGDAIAWLSTFLASRTKLLFRLVSRGLGDGTATPSGETPS